jgi:hypothetical protein
MEITGHLRLNDLGKWEIVADDGSTCVLSSGWVCEVLIAGHWIRTRLEFCYGSPPLGGYVPCGWPIDHDGHYYAVERGVLLCEGLPARVTERRDWSS